MDVHRSFIPKHWRQPKYPSTGEWTNKLWYIYIVINKGLIHTTWMNFKNIILRKRSQTKDYKQ